MRILIFIGMAAIVTVLTVQASWIGTLCGLALIGLTALLVQSPQPRLSEDNTGNAIQRKVAATLDQVPGITAAHPRDFRRALPIMTLKDGTTVRTWKNPVGCNHIFLADSGGHMVYGAYVGWIHNQGLQKTVAKIRRDFS